MINEMNRRRDKFELREALVKNWIDGLKKIGFEPTKRDICFFKTGFNMCWSAERNSTKEE